MRFQRQLPYCQKLARRSLLLSKPGLQSSWLIGHAGEASLGTVIGSLGTTIGLEKTWVLSPF